MRYARGHSDDERRGARRAGSSRPYSSRSGAQRSYGSRDSRMPYDDYDDLDEFDDYEARPARSSRSRGERPARNTRPVPDRRNARDRGTDRERRIPQRSDSRGRLSFPRSENDDRIRESSQRSRRRRDERPARDTQSRRRIDDRRAHADDEPRWQREVPSRRSPDFDPFEPQTRPASQRRPRGYDELDERSRAASRMGDQRARYSEPAPDASHYARSSERYSRPAPARGSQRARVQSIAPERHESMGRTGSAQRNTRNPNADRYSRDRYLKQPGQGRATSVSHQNYQSMRREKPVNSNIVLILGAVAAFLLLILVVRFIAFSGTAADYNAVKDEIKQESVQTEELDAQNTDLQSEIDSMQELIEQYNKQKR